MSRRMRSEEAEDQDNWITRIIRDRLIRGDEFEAEDDPGFGTAPVAPEPARDGRESRDARAGRRPATGQPGGTLLQVHAHRGSQITKRAPRSLADAQRAAEDLKERRPVIVNLERADDELARRVIDFISGVTYALNGYYERVGDKVFLFTPANICISDEDELEPPNKGLYADDDLAMGRGR